MIYTMFLFDNVTVTWANIMCQLSIYEKLVMFLLDAAN